jgi:SAM-dependent methyltransferase
MEPAMRQLYVSILDRIDPLAGQTLVDVGCGAGLFCRLAADRGASVHGLDAAPALLDIARRRVPSPQGTFDLGDVGNLPYADATFDVVAGINSFQYASSPIAALREAKRVAKPDAQIVVAALGNVDECEAASYLYAIAALVPSTAGTPGPFALSQPSALEALAREADLTSAEVADVAVEWCFADLDDALDALLSSGPAVRAIQLVGERRVRRAVAEAIRPFGTARGDYRLENMCRFLIART